MRRLTSIFLASLILGAILTSVLFTGCETSEGTKFGTLQKVSHKKGITCDYYVAEFAYTGGKSSVDSDGKAQYSNTQEVRITKEESVNIQQYLGKEVVFDYTSERFVMCGPDNRLTLIKLAH